MAAKKNKKKKTHGQEKPEISFVSGTDFYIYGLLLGELSAGNNAANNKINKKDNKKIINKIKNQNKTK